MKKENYHKEPCQCGYCYPERKALWVCSKAENNLKIDRNVGMSTPSPTTTLQVSQRGQTPDKRVEEIVGHFCPYYNDDCPKCKPKEIELDEINGKPILCEWCKECNLGCRKCGADNFITTLTQHHQDKMSEVEGKYQELILAVGSKFDGETRHETALRYIKQAEQRAEPEAQTIIKSLRK